jgi:sulfatase modifying factor 1
MRTPTILGLTSIVLAGTMMNAEAITIAHGGDSVDIDFVDIGNVGNTGDTAVAGYGAVDYEYSIGKFEVTADQWAAVIAADSVVGNAGNWSGSQPTASSSWYEAAKFANWLTSGDALQGAYGFSDATTFTGVDRDTALTTFGTIYVLPTEDEWYKAAYLKSDGSGYTTYATGNSTPDGIGFAGDTDYDSVFNDGYSNGAPLAVGGGSMENNGTYDMGGNVWEWGESAFSGGEPTGDELRVLRGRAWSSGSGGLQSSDRGGGGPVGEGNDFGFRVASVSAAVAAVPEPSSVGLLVIGAMGCMLRRKRG